MTVQINQLPAGLLSLLGSKGGQSNPSELSDLVACVLEIRDLYLSVNREVINDGNVAAAVGVLGFPNGTLVVPPGEIWYVWDYEVICAPGAGAAVKMAPAYQTGPGGLAMVLSDFQSAAANEQVRVASRRYPMLWTAATTGIVVVQSQTLAPNISGGAIITRLKI
jgi:hypothetical protein